MTKKQHYMTRDERLQLEALRKAGIPVAKIARQLGFSRQTIYNELRRGEYLHNVEYIYERRYSADKAQQIHNYNQTAKGRPLKIGNDFAYADFLERKIIEERFSPAAALASARRAGFKTSVCVTTIYTYIDHGVFYRLNNKDLLEKRKRKEKKEKTVSRVVHKKLPSIEERPQHINDRQEYGHWEMDLVIGKQGTNPCLLTLTERKSRQEMIFKLPNKKAATIRNVFDRMEKSMGKKKFRETFRSLTTDNGSEFLEYDKLRKSVYKGERFDVWYCHSYAAWEKGSNENHNRMIRRWFPKGTDFSKVTPKEIAAIQEWMNSYPRKILGWKTPNEVA